MVFYYAVAEAGDGRDSAPLKKCFSNSFLVNVYNFNSKITKILIFLK
jgi:hypothetical protein